MLPASLTPASVLANKLKEYHSGLSGDHRPNVTMGHLSVPKNNQGKTHQTQKGQELVNPAKRYGGQYFTGGLPTLNWRQAELYGLIDYQSDATHITLAGRQISR
jgi:hypothetical protein